MPQCMPLLKSKDKMQVESLLPKVLTLEMLCDTQLRTPRSREALSCTLALVMITWESGMDLVDIVTSTLFTKSSARDGPVSPSLLFPQRRLSETKIWFSSRNVASTSSNSSAS